MATRHDTSNLERRGHTFYWRARVPTRFRKVPPQARLSFSLRLSDHHKAAYMARRLNTLLADLKIGYRQLFPELFSPLLKTNDPGDRFYKDFIPIVKASPHFSSELWKRSIHALRHGFSDTMKQAGVDTAIISDISGRLGESETALRYTNVAGLPLIKKQLEKYPVITGHLEARPVHLLPWVENEELPPWAGKKPGDRFRK